MIPASLVWTVGKYAVPALLAGALAWQVQSWRYGAELSNIREQQAHAIAVAHGRMQDMSNRLAAADKQAIAKLTEARHENDSLRRAVAADTIRLRVKARCLPNNPQATSVGDAGSAELSPDAGQDVLSIRAGIIELEAKLAALRQYAESVSQ